MLSVHFLASRDHGASQPRSGLGRVLATLIVTAVGMFALTSAASACCSYGCCDCSCVTVLDKAKAEEIMQAVKDVLRSNGADCEPIQLQATLVGREAVPRSQVVVVQTDRSGSIQQPSSGRVSD